MLGGNLIMAGGNDYNPQGKIILEWGAGTKNLYYTNSSGANPNIVKYITKLYGPGNNDNYFAPVMFFDDGSLGELLKIRKYLSNNPKYATGGSGFIKVPVKITEKGAFLKNGETFTRVVTGSYLNVSNKDGYTVKLDWGTPKNEYGRPFPWQLLLKYDTNRAQSARYVGVAVKIFPTEYSSLDTPDGRSQSPHLFSISKITIEVDLL